MTLRFLVKFKLNDPYGEEKIKSSPARVAKIEVPPRAQCLYVLSKYASIPLATGVGF